MVFYNLWNNHHICRNNGAMNAYGKNYLKYGKQENRIRKKIRISILIGSGLTDIEAER